MNKRPVFFISTGRAAPAFVTRIGDSAGIRLADELSYLQFQVSRIERQVIGPAFAAKQFVPVACAA